MSTLKTKQNIAINGRQEIYLRGKGEVGWKYRYWCEHMVVGLYKVSKM
jgi:hypothetical protein